MRGVNVATPTAPPPTPVPVQVGVGRRAVAVLLDTIVLLVLGWLIAGATGGTVDGGFALTGAPAFVFMALAFAYYVVLEKVSGATLGKRLVGIEVTTEDGAPLDWSAALVRNVLRLVDGFAFYLVGAVLVWTSSRRQRLGDRVAATVVVPRSSRI
jgi:uncharacterized RDD family membrane protein YckC